MQTTFLGRTWRWSWGAVVPITLGLVVGCGDDEPVEPGATGGSASEPAGFAPAPGGIRRLLARQYVGSIEVVLGEAAAEAADPPEDASLAGLEVIAARELPMPPWAVEKYEQSARAVAAAVVADEAHLASISPCTPASPDDVGCFADFARGLARIAWRRDLEDDEVARLAEAARNAATSYGAAERGVEYAIAAILQAPDFLYIVEIGEPDEADPTRRRLTPNELVTRMSFFLTGRTPTAELLELADAGGVSTDEGIREAARMLTNDPATRREIGAFYGELFEFRDLDGVAKDPALYPSFTTELRASMREETLRFVEHVVFDEGVDARRLFDADYTFADANLASFYGVAAPATAWDRTELPSEQARAGILSQGSILATNAHPGMTSPTRRGHFVQTVLLCTGIQPPPPGVNPSLPPEGDTPTTTKQKLEQHMNDPACATCHQLMDPIGLSLENFDAIGAYRTTDAGEPIDTTAEVHGIGEFASAAELGALLRDDPRALSCMARQLFRQSTGHIELDSEIGALDEIDAAFAASGYRLRELLVEIAVSPAFRLVGEPK